MSDAAKIETQGFCPACQQGYKLTKCCQAVTFFLLNAFTSAACVLCLQYSTPSVKWSENSKVSAYKSPLLYSPSLSKHLNLSSLYHFIHSDAETLLMLWILAKLWRGIIPAYLLEHHLLVKTATIFVYYLKNYYDTVCAFLIFALTLNFSLFVVYYV